MTKEQKFYNILQDLFVGAKLEGDSGYVNLMNIKTDYFNKIKVKIEEEVKRKFGDSKPEDLYDKLYTFFDSYFSDGGSIFFSSTPSYKNIYAKIYSDREDVSLFWKTSKLYYVKSEANYRTIENLQLNSDPEIAFDFQFDASLLKHKQGNEKKELVFFFIGTQKRANKKIIKFRVIYKNDNKYDKLKEILNIKDNTKLIKYIFENSSKLNKKINFKNDGLDLKIIKEKGGKEFVKAELFIQNNNDLLDCVTVEPVISDTNDIEKYLRLKSIVLNVEDIEKAFKVYKKQTEIDYFIHKDAKGFLKEQFDLYMYQHLTGNMETIFDQNNLEQFKKIKEIAYLSINYIGNFEDELKKIWLKPKFARKSNYVITLDKLINKINGVEVIEKILKSRGIKDQIIEWQELAIVNKDFDKKEVIKEKKLNIDCEKLPVDTKYFKDLEAEIISLFDNLDEELDGRLIKSDNFQALNTLLPKYKEQVQTIYIDPPFNTNSSPIAYVNDYKDSSWLTLMENRFNIAKYFLKNGGINITAIDDVELRYITALQDDVFGKENYITTIASECNPQGRVANKISQTSEYHVIHANNKEAIDKLLVKKLEVKKPTPLKRTGTNSRREERPNRYYPILIKDEKIFMITLDEYNKIYDNNRKIFDDKFVSDLEKKYKKLGYNFILPLGEHGEKFVWQRVFSRVMSEKETYTIKNNNIFTPSFEVEIPKTLWKNPLFSNPEYGSEYLTNMLGHSEFETPKSYYTIMQFLSMAGGSGIYLDYFGGSGTTAQAVLELNKIEDENDKKYLIFEMGDYFYSVIIPRLKKLCIASKWKKGSPANKDGISQFFKYYELEQYEDALKKAVYSPTIEELENIDFSLSEKQAKVALDIDLKKEKAKFIFENLYQDVDIPETISNLFGKKIKKILKDKVIFEDESEIDLNNLDFEKYEPLKKLIYW